jgi:hypothetical protein
MLSLNGCTPWPHNTHCEQVLVHIDGFTQIPQVHPESQAKHAHVDKDELLPPCTMSGQDTGNPSNGPKAQKHYYYVVTMPGVGCAAVAALKSGSRKLPAASGEFHFWMDQLLDLGLGTPEQQTELQKRVWKVMFLVPYGLFWQ